MLICAKVFAFTVLVLFNWWNTVTALPKLGLQTLQDISITKLGELLTAGDLSSRDLVDLYIRRAEQVNDELHAVIEINPDALRIAEHLDFERANGVTRGPLHGIPILVKDNYATVDSMLTGAGSVCLARAKPAAEATVVARLRAAGAIILGKTNLDEFAGARGMNATSGWSPRGGQTFGAYVKHQTPCGSSGGSGVAASLGLAAGTLGTETSGSITCPAMYNNVVGIKPTVGLTSRYGVVPLTPRQDTTGPLAQSVEDAALILDAIAWKDARDNYTSAQPWNDPPAFAAALDISALREARIGVIWMNESFINAPNFFNSEIIRPIFDRAVSDLEEAGAKTIGVELDLRGHSVDEFVEMVLSNVSIYETADFREAMNHYMQLLEPGPDVFHNLTDLLHCLKTEPEELASRMPFTEWDEMNNSNISAGSMEAWNAYVTASALSRNLVLGPIKKHKLDALVVLPEIALALGASPGLPIVTVPSTYSCTGSVSPTSSL